MGQDCLRTEQGFVARIKAFRSEARCEDLKSEEGECASVNRDSHARQWLVHAGGVGCGKVAGSADVRIGSLACSWVSCRTGN
ncbi:hypothetical protein KFK09_002442 [Dendrobium nobile]|uniref:Uncharacterized protein n=1 Tax=Dendrobium nobile TaxID=94219 RepID=A0A8T3C6F6_DENNO|nr:hypothetical protein KFK09_002442 [Dendrobium nobile]